MVGETLLNRYKIESELGKGGMGVVYQAHDTLLNRAVAIKFLNTAGVGTEGKARLIQEARAVAQLNHPNIVSVYDAGEIEGNPFIVMELVRGNTLRQTEKPTITIVIHMAQQICLALDHAHTNGIIHRDLKLENIVVTNTQTLKLMDFGLARTTDDAHLTQEGALMGTLAYIAPELIQGQPATAQSDLYAFGIILYELLVGNEPFQGNMGAVLGQHLHGQVTPPSKFSGVIPDWVDELVLGLLNKRPEERPASARAVLNILEQKITPPITTAYRIASKPKNNLPVQLTSFIGRKKEVEQIKKRLEKNRLVTLTGSGGIGKTRLSIQVAFELLREYPNGVWLVELAPLTNPTLVIQAVCTALDVTPQGDIPVLNVLIDYLHSKQILLVIDNCEHLIDACAQLTESLLRSCPDLRIIASSREALGIDGENTYRVPSLSLPNPNNGLQAIEKSEAVKLFIERATATLSEFEITETNASVVAQICQRLDGIALAIELAASRVKILKVEQIASRLDDAFRLLTGGSRTALPRQQTLRALIDWSYNLLSDEEKAVLRRLSVFVGGWTLEAAEFVCDNSNMLDMMTHLVDKSLVAVDLEHGDGPRYYLLETVRQYAREKLVESEASTHLRDIHLDYFLKLAERIAPELYHHKMPYWLDYLETEYANLHAALEWAQERDVKAGLRLCNALFRFWENRGEHTNEGWEWFKLFLEVSGASRTSSRAWALYHAFVLTGLISETIDSSKVRELYDECLLLAHEMGERVCIARILEQNGFYERLAYNYDTSRELLKQSLAEARLLNDDLTIGYATLRLGVLALDQSDYSIARSFLEESVEILSRVGELRRLGLALYYIGGMYYHLGNWSASRKYYEDALLVAQKVHSRLYISLYLSSLGNLALGLGDFDQALSLLYQALELVQDTPINQSSTLIRLGEIARFQANYDQATICYRKVLALLSDDLQKVDIYCCLANVELVCNQIEEARQHLLTALEIKKTLRDKYSWDNSITCSAYFAVRQEKYKQAMILLGWVDRWRKTTLIVYPPIYQTEDEHYLNQAREQLSESEFVAAWAEGQSMSPTQILESAKEILQ